MINYVCKMVKARLIQVQFAQRLFAQCLWPCLPLAKLHKMPKGVIASNSSSRVKPFSKAGSILIESNLATQTFSVSKATAVRWAKQLRDTGHVAITLCSSWFHVSSMVMLWFGIIAVTSRPMRSIPQSAALVHGSCSCHPRAA